MKKQIILIVSILSLWIGQEYCQDSQNLLRETGQILYGKPGFKYKFNTKGVSGWYDCRISIRDYWFLWPLYTVKKAPDFSR